jgi:hypothetical protein
MAHPPAAGLAGAEVSGGARDRSSLEAQEKILEAHPRLTLYFLARLSASPHPAVGSPSLRVSRGPGFLGGRR